MSKYNKRFRENLGYLIAFRLKKSLKAAERVRFCQRLYGYLDRSQYGNYRYQREGFLKGIPYLTPIRGVLIVKSEDREKVLGFLKGKVEMYVREVVLKPEDLKMLVKSLALNRKALKKLNKELLR
jgi:hypothetical protein